MSECRNRQTGQLEVLVPRKGRAGSSPASDTQEGDPGAGDRGRAGTWLAQGHPRPSGKRAFLYFAALAQLARAIPLYGKGQRFESAELRTARWSVPVLAAPPSLPRR